MRGLALPHVLVGNLLAKDLHEAWGPDHKVPLRNGRRVSRWWRRHKKAQQLLHHQQKKAKKDGRLTNIMKVKPVRQSRFCDMQRQQRQWF